MLILRKKEEVFLILAKLIQIRDFIIKNNLKNFDKSNSMERNGNFEDSNNYEIELNTSKLKSKSTENREKSILAFERCKQIQVKYRQELEERIKMKDNKITSRKTHPNKEKMDQVYLISGRIKKFLFRKKKE